MIKIPLIQHSRRREYLLYLIIFFIFSLAIFWPSILGDPFWDDWVFLFKKANTVMLQNSPVAFFLGNSSKAWPIFYTFFWGLYKFFKTNYYLYHLVNIFFHALDGLLCWIILRKLKVRNSFLLVLLFLCHPLQLFVVSWIIQLKTILSIFFFLISLLFLIKFYNKGQNKYYHTSIFFFILSLMTKSTTVAFGACLLFSYPLFKRKINLKKFVTFFIIPFLILSAAATMKTAWPTHFKKYFENESIEKITDVQAKSDQAAYDLEQAKTLKPGEVFYSDLPLLDKSMLTFKVFIRYVVFLVVPIGGQYIFQTKTDLSFTSLEFLLLFASLSAFYLFFKYLIKRRLHLELLGLIFFIASLLPFCGMFYIPIFFISNFMPYWLSIPFLGLLPLISHFIKSKKILLTAIVVYTAITHWQTYQFIHVENILAESIAKTPEKKIYQVGLIEHYYFMGECKKASDLYKTFQEEALYSMFCLDFKIKTCKPREEVLK